MWRVKEEKVVRGLQQNRKRDSTFTTQLSSFFISFHVEVADDEYNGTGTRRDKMYRKVGLQWESSDVVIEIKE